MKEMKRILSLVLCFVMLVSLIPAGALSVRAEEGNDPVVVVAASDFQQNAGHSASDSVMEGIIGTIQSAGYTDVDGAIFCGDYSNQMTAKDSNEGLSYVYGNYNGTWGLDYDDIVFVQGNHDPADTSYLDPTGANDPKSGKYGVFVLNEDDYSWHGGTEDDVKTLAGQLKTYLDAKIEAKFDAPIFIASHLPLHYSMRTYNDGDCRYAQYIFDVLNEASEAGLNIIYLYGHNHSQSFENYHGGGAVFYSAGDDILISDTTSNKTHHTETIQFTYLNAGYTGRFDSTDTADATNTGTVFAIYDDEVVITRYDANGTHNLKSAGVQSKAYPTEAFLYGVNDRVVKSSQTIELKQFDSDSAAEPTPTEPETTEPTPTEPETTEPVSDTNTGIVVAAPGVTDVTVEVKTVSAPTGYSAYASYDITLDGYTQGDTATVTIPAPAGFDTSKSAVVLHDGEQIAEDADLSDGITFTTDHFSTYDVAQLAEGDDEDQTGTTVNDFPSYPEGGSVLVNKTGEGQDFQNTGVARVNLSTSGLPSTKGADVIVMLDTSSSMTSNNVDNGSQSRAAALREALTELVNQLQADGSDGQPMDIKIAIADFNGYYVSNSNKTRPYNLETTDHLKGTTVKSSSDNFKAQVYTGSKGLNASAFVSVHDLNSQTIANSIQFSSGTNYDYAFDAVYQLGEAIKAANEEERDLYVVFMSDGGPFQYNYFSTQSEANNGGERWNHWLTGNVANDDWDNTTHSYFYNSEGKHWMAEAIKGDPTQNYTVIRKNANSSDFIDVTGDGNADDYMIKVPGLGATMYSIGFCAEKNDNAILASSIKYVLQNIASDISLYHNANDGDDLKNAFSAIVSDIRYAAQNAYFVDQMGDAYDLQMNPNIVDSSDNTRTDISTDITVTSYPVYTEAQIGTTVDGHQVTAEDVGKTYGAGTVMETVVFTSDTAATSSALTDANIIKDGIICAKYFWYNTTNSAKTITLANGTTYELPGETFYWNIGLINEKQFTLSYAVYLTGSMEGTCPEGSYDTNNYATLYYTNWLDHDVEQSVDSPTLPWGGANVSYAFYLVNSEGKPVDANGAEVPNIVTAYKVTRPVLYKTIYLNSGETVLSTVADDVLPAGYTLYDEEAVYTVTVNSGSGGGGWTITGNYPATTYVTNHAGENEYSNATPVSDATYDYTHTTVYFAVVWTIGTVPDTVVIDFGLPVDIDVMFNDMFGKDGTLTGIGAKDSTDGALSNTYDGTYGTATLYNGKVRYTPNTMAMDSYDQFTYAVNYTGSTNPGYYYGTVTVIPATTIYYEDSFVKFDNLTWQQDGENSWDGKWVVDANANGSIWTQESDGTTVSGATQAEDRPGFYSLTDANNIYGYDAVYSNCSTYSLGSAMKATVDYDHGAQASFTFYGTGFDVVSMTNTTTGTIQVRVYSVNEDGTRGEKVKGMTVDTYYGYKLAECHVVYTWRKSEWIMTDVLHTTNYCTTDKCNEKLVTSLPETGTEGQEVHMVKNTWTKDSNAEGTLWQVPVAEVEGLPYGKYEAVIQAIYEPSFDHVGGSLTGTYDFYLDAIRIYDPANDGAADGSDDKTIENAYEADGEGWPSYIELRNKIIAANSFDDVANEVLTEDIEGLVFIDGDSSVGDAQIADYISYGPNNEVYLAHDQSVAFLLSTPANIKNVHIGIKSADGKPVTYTIANIARATDSETGIAAGTRYNEKTDTISSTNDMYYDLTSWKGEIIVISNTGSDGIISLTNIKSTYTSNPANGAQTASDGQNDGLMTASEEELTETYIYMTRTASTLTLRSLNSAVQEEVPEETEPETTVPEETEPETTVPEETEPETTVPEETEPETTQPAPGSGSIGGVWDLIIKIIGWIFG